MFERFDDRGRRVVVYAQEASRLLGSGEIAVVHMLLGLLQGDGDVPPVLAAAGISYEDALGVVGSTPGSGGKRSGHIPFTKGAKKVLESADREAVRLHGGSIRPAHLLLGVLGVDDDAARSLLAHFGVDLAALAAVAESLGGPGYVPEPADDGVGSPSTSLSASGGGWFGAGRPKRRGEQVDDDRQQLAAGLLRYGRHDASCDVRRCTCGFERLSGIARGLL